MILNAGTSYDWLSVGNATGKMLISDFKNEKDNV